MIPRKAKQLDPEHNPMLKDPEVINEYVRRSAYLIKLTPRDKKLMAAAFNAGYEYRVSLEGRVFG